MDRQIGFHKQYTYLQFHLYNFYWNTHNFQKTQRKERKRHGEHMEFGDHDDDNYGDGGFNTSAYHYNGCIHVSGTGQRKQISN